MKLSRNIVHPVYASTKLCKHSFLYLPNHFDTFSLFSRPFALRLYRFPLRQLLSTSA